MARHLRQREPRGHWLLVCLLAVSLGGVLLIQGFAEESADGPASDPRTERAAAGSPADSPALADSRPVLNLGSSQPTGRGMPARTLALTFDDGPDPRWTPRLLDVLRRHHAHATFFVLGSQVAAEPELARRIVAEGHEIGSHTYTHVDLGQAAAWRRDLELTLTQQALAGATGLNTRLFRPPYVGVPGDLDGPAYDAAARVSRAGYLVVLADHDPRDWSARSAGEIVAAATPRPDRGGVVLMHDGGGDRRRTVAAVDLLLTRLERQGYSFTTVSEGVGLPSSAVRVGRVERATGATLAAAQRTGRFAAELLTVALTVAAVLTVLRFLVLMVVARVHARRSRRERHARAFSVSFHPPVSVVVPAFNEAAGIAACVRSLVTTGYPGEVEVIVVDDGSTDDTAAIAYGLGLPDVHVVRQPNAGKPAALNTGFGYACHDVVVLVDGDTVFEDGTIERLVAPLADPAVGAVSGNTKVGNPHGILGRWQHIEYVIGFNLDRRMFDVLECMPTVPGAIGAFRRTALDEVGGLSADTLAEDTDLTMALCRAGWRIRYEETARAWTEAPHTLRQLWRQRYRWCYGTLQAMWKHRRALVEHGAAGRFGRRGLTYLAFFQIALPLLAPAVDVFAVYGLLFLQPVGVIGVWVGFVLLQAFVGAFALRLDHERFGSLWALPLQQFVYRQLMYLVVIQSVVTALVGAPLRWHALRRQGTFAEGAPGEVATP